MNTRVQILPLIFCSPCNFIFLFFSNHIFFHIMHIRKKMQYFQKIIQFIIYLSYLSILYLILGQDEGLCWWSVSKCALKCVTIPNWAQLSLLCFSLHQLRFSDGDTRLRKILRESKKPAVQISGKWRSSHGSIIWSGPPGFTRVAAILAAMAQETRRSFLARPNPSRRLGSVADTSRCVNENILNTTDLQDKFRQKSTV